MQLRITSNPHLKQEDSKAFVENLLSRRNLLYGLNNDVPLDQEGLMNLKKQLSKESRLIKVSDRMK